MFMIYFQSKENKQNPQTNRYIFLGIRGSKRDAALYVHRKQQIKYPTRDSYQRLPQEDLLNRLPRHAQFFYTLCCNFPCVSKSASSRTFNSRNGQHSILENLFLAHKTVLSFLFQLSLVLSLILEEGGVVQSRFIGTFLHHTVDKLLRSQLVYKNEILSPSLSSMLLGLAPPAVNSQGPAVGKTKQVSYAFWAWSFVGGQRETIT